MSEVTVPALVEPPAHGNIANFLDEHADTAPDRVLISRRTDIGWEDVTAVQFRDSVQQLGRGLIAAGVTAGDRVFLMSATRYEWTLIDFAIWSIGGVTVPIYETSSQDQISWILADSGATVGFVENLAHAAAIEQASNGACQPWTIDEAGIDQLCATGRTVPDRDFSARRSAAQPTDLATIIYTSGTTGRPKGCELTHANFMTLVDNTLARLGIILHEPGACTIVFLPLAHVFARLIQVLVIRSGARLGHTPNIKNLAQDFAEFKPSFLLAVPRVFEKIYNSAEAKAQASGRSRIFKIATKTAIEYSHAQEKGTIPLDLRVRHALVDRLVFGKIRAGLGGNLRYAVSGGAPLGTRLGHFYRGIGLCILEGYGLTETTAPSTANTPEQVRIGSVGRPLPGVSIKLAEDGEILIRGPHVFRGYHNDAEATAGAFRDGWFQTGDLGQICDDFLTITGRKKEMIVTAGGKNVAPAALEDSLRAHPLISQCVVIGDQRPYIAALITLDSEMLPTWLHSHGHPILTATEASTSPIIRAEISRAISQTNTSVSKAESIRDFLILPQDFSEEGGHLTPSLKVRKQLVLADYADLINGLYRSTLPDSLPAIPATTELSQRRNG